MANQYRVAKGSTMKGLIGGKPKPASPLFDIDAPTITSLRAEGAGNTPQAQERSRRVSRISGRYAGQRLAPKDAAIPTRDADLSKLMAAINMPKSTSEMMIDTSREAWLADYIKKAQMADGGVKLPPLAMDTEAQAAAKGFEGQILGPKILKGALLPDDNIQTVMAAYDRANYGKRTYGESLGMSDAVKRASFKAQALKQIAYAERMAEITPGAEYRAAEIAEEEAQRLKAIERLKAEGKPIPEVLQKPRETYFPSGYDPFARQMAESGDVGQYDNPAVFGGMLATGALSPFTTAYKIGSAKTEDEFTPMEAAITFLADVAFGMTTMAAAGQAGAAQRIGSAIPKLSPKAATAAGHLAAAAAFEVPQWIPQFYVAGGGDPVKGATEVFKNIANSYNPLFYMDPNIPDGVKTASAMQAGLLAWGAFVGGNATVAKYRNKRLAIPDSDTPLSMANEVAVAPMTDTTGAAFNAGAPNNGATPVRLLADGEAPKPGEKVVHITEAGKLADGEPSSGRANEAAEAPPATQPTSSPSAPPVKGRQGRRPVEMDKSYLPTGGTPEEKAEWGSLLHKLHASRYARGRKLTKTEMARLRELTPKFQGSFAMNEWREAVDAQPDPFTKKDVLEIVANAGRRVTDADLVDVLNRLDEAAMGSGAWNVAHAVSVHPSASDSTKARAVAMREEWMRPGRHLPELSRLWQDLQAAEDALASVAKRNGENRTRALVEGERIESPEKAKRSLEAAKKARDKAQEAFEKAREKATPEEQKAFLDDEATSPFYEGIPDGMRLNEPAPVEIDPDLKMALETIPEEGRPGTLKEPSAYDFPELDNIVEKAVEDAINGFAASQSALDALENQPAPKVKGRQGRKPKGRSKQQGGYIDLSGVADAITRAYGKVTGRWKPNSNDLVKAHEMFKRAAKEIIDTLESSGAIKDPAKFADDMAAGTLKMSENLEKQLRAVLAGPDAGDNKRLAAQALLDNPLGAEVAFQAAKGDRNPLKVGMRSFRSIPEAIAHLGDDAAGLKEFMGKVLFPSLMRASARANMMVAAAQTLAKSIPWEGDMKKRLAVGDYLRVKSDIDMANAAGNLDSGSPLFKRLEDAEKAMLDLGLTKENVDNDMAMLRNYVNMAYALVNEGRTAMTGQGIGNLGPSYWTRAYAYQTPWDMFAGQLSGETRMRSTHETFGYSAQTGAGENAKSVVLGREPAAAKVRTREKGVPVQYDPLTQFAKYISEMANDAAYYAPMRIATGLLDAVNAAALAKKQLEGGAKFDMTTDQAAAAKEAQRNRFLEKRGAVSRNDESVFGDAETDKAFNEAMTDVANELWGDIGRGHGDAADLVADLFARATGLDTPEAYQSQFRNVMSNISVMGGRFGANLTRMSPGTLVAQIAGLATQFAMTADMSHIPKLIMRDKNLLAAMDKSSMLKLNEHGPRLDSSMLADIKSGVFKDGSGGLPGFMKRMFNLTASPGKDLNEAGSWMVREFQTTLDKMAWAAIYLENQKFGTALDMDPIAATDAKFAAMYPRSGVSSPRVYKNPALAAFTTLTSEPFSSAKAVGRALIGKGQPFDVQSRQNRAARMIGAAVAAHGVNMLSQQISNRNVAPIDPMAYLEDAIAITEDNEVAREVSSRQSKTVFTGINTKRMLSMAADKFRQGDFDGGLRILSIYPEQMKVAPIGTMVNMAMRGAADFGATIPAGNLAAAFLDDEFRRTSFTGSPYEYGASSPALGLMNDVGRLLARAWGGTRNTDADTERLGRTALRMFVPWAMIAVRALDAKRFSQGEIVNPNASKSSRFSRRVFSRQTGREPNALEEFVMAPFFGPESLDQGKQIRRLEQAKKTKGGIMRADRKIRELISREKRP